MLKLPTKLEAEFKLLCNVEPSSVARGLSDLAGGAGATWVATTTERLVFFCRSATSGDFEMVPYRYADASAFELEDDGKFTFLNITFPDRQVHLKFSSMEQPTLTKIQDNWKPVTADTDMRAPKELTPMLVFLASLQALIQADHDLASQELGWIQEHMIDTNALRRAGAWLREHSVEELVVHINEKLDETQKRCLHANLISLAMADGHYRPKEEEIINKVRDKVGLSQKDHDKIFDLLMARNNLSVFGGEDGQYVSPEAINLCCACLLAMSKYDGERHEREEKLVRKIIRQSETINSARTYLEQLGLKDLLSFLPGPLTQEQKRCTLLNLLEVAMADGIFNSHKQDLLDRFRRRLQIDADVFKADFDLYLTFQNLSVFAPKEDSEAGTEETS